MLNINSFFLWLCMLCSLPLMAQFELIDKHALAAPKHLNYDLKKLNEYLISPTKNDLEKTRAFYIWLTHNIAYDIKQYKNITSGKESDISYANSIEIIDNQIIEQTLKTKTGVCQGYSLIFTKLCTLNNIPSFSISGYSRNGQQTHLALANHAWNVAFVNEKWRLFDPTWGAGHVVNERYFEKEYNEVYFDTKPDVMILNHLPSDPIWQLLPNPISYNDFINNNIKAKLAETKTPIFAYQDSIQKLLSYPKEMQEVISAENAFKFNPKNAEDLGYALNNYAVRWSNKSISLDAANRPIDEVLEANMHAIEAQKKAVFYTNDAQLKEGLGVFYTNHAKFYQDKGYQKLQNQTFDDAISAYNTSLEYLELARPFFGNNKSLLESEGTSQLNLGFVYSSIAQKKINWKSNFEMALVHYEKAKKLLTQANTSLAKKNLQIVEKNIQSVKQNQRIFGQNK